MCTCMYLCLCVYIKIYTEYLCNKTLRDGAMVSFSFILSHLKVPSKLLNLPEIQYVSSYRESENYYLLQSFLAVATVITYARM